MAIRQISLRLPEELLARIEAQRDDVPRERFLRRVIEGRIDEMEGVDRLVDDSGEGVPIRHTADFRRHFEPRPKGGK